MSLRSAPRATLEAEGLPVREGALGAEDEGWREREACWCW